MEETVYQLRIKTPDDWDVLDESKVMQLTLAAIEEGEDDVRVLGISVERVSDPLAPAPEVVTAEVVKEIHKLLEEEPTDPAYAEGWRDALRRALEAAGEETPE